MADSNIGSLPPAATLNDDSFLVAEQQGQAVKVTGAQFKEFGRQAVISEVQGYVDQAEAAANQAVSAVSSVTDMTVEAETLSSGQDATVTKSEKNGKVNLKFGLPRGEQGIQGPAGPEGPKGPKGEKGDGLDIVGRYDTTADVPDPQEGKSYYIGTQAPYDICTYINGGWVNNGPISGGGSGPLPENVVTADGGASMSFPVDLGDGPHVITFVNEEEPPLTAEDVVYSDTQNVKQAIDDLKSSVSNGKALIASAITDKGINTAQDATFAEMAENIGEISTGSDTSDATATSFDILAGKTAYTAAGKVEGAIPTLLGQTITPGTADKTISNGQYLGGTQVIKGDPNLTSNNIKSGVTLFGVEGALESTFQATLTVTADIGAVVTATHTDGTEVSALSQTGTVVLDLPKEGTWKVTAVRGVAQYNTVTIQVSSQYSAELTAEVHIEYVGVIEQLKKERRNLASISFGNLALFGGGVFVRDFIQYRSDVSYYVDIYDTKLTHTSAELMLARGYLAAAANKNYGLFGGGVTADINQNNSYDTNTVDAFDQSVTRITPEPLSTPRSSLAAASVGEYVLFGGGRKNYVESSVVDAYNSSLVRTTVTSLILPGSFLAASSNEKYAIFSGGNVNGKTPSAYDSSLVRSTPASMGEGRKNLAAARAGNYVLFSGGDANDGKTYYTSVDAYDLFLTKTTPDLLSIARNRLSGTTIRGFAVFAGGATISTASGVVDVYDPYLVRTTVDSLSVPRFNLSSASVGDYALFGGGTDTGNNRENTVEAYRYV